MEPNSLHKANYREALKSQVKESYGKVVYTHKAHEKAADILLSRNDIIKLGQLILSALTTGSLLVTLFSNEYVSTLIAAILSTVLLILNSYSKGFDLVSLAEEHSHAALELWNIRENYLSLLVDFDTLPINQIVEKRDQLQSLVLNANANAPRTNSKFYNNAVKAIQKNEELYFSKEEIDHLLPSHLRGKEVG